MDNRETGIVGGAANLFKMNFCVDSSTIERPAIQPGDGGAIPTSTLKISKITKAQAEPLLKQHHYLSKISRGFKSKINFGLFLDGRIVGVCVFTGFPVPELVVGMFGLPRTEQSGFFELSRLCLDPILQKQKNIASWFVGFCIRQLRRERNVRAILSYADSEFHSGVVYKALGFGYYGLSEPKNDFFLKLPDGSFQKCSRGGSIKNHSGEWRPRSRKHRFLLVFDKSLRLRWAKVEYPR